MVRVSERRSILNHGEEPNEFALAHCRFKNAAENFDRHVTLTLCQNYSKQDFFQDYLALKDLAFLTVCGEYPTSLLTRFRVRDRNCFSFRFIFRITGNPPDGFSRPVKTRLTLAPLKTLDALIMRCFFQDRIVGAVVVLSALSLFSQPHLPKQETQMKLGSSFVAVRFFCSWPIRTCLSQTVS